jgi:hypothetical protein
VLEDSILYAPDRKAKDIMRQTSILETFDAEQCERGTFTLSGTEAGTDHRLFDTSVRRLCIAYHASIDFTRSCEDLLLYIFIPS